MKKFLFISLILMTCFGTTLSAKPKKMPCFGTTPSAKSKKTNILCSTHGHQKASEKSFKHDIQLQLSDSLGFPVAGTQFCVTLDIVKNGDLVTIQLPLINFEMGPVSSANPFFPSGEFLAGLPPAGGYLYTSAGFLSEELRPNDLVPRSIVAASNNGLSLPFSFTQDPATLPNPSFGYIVQITNSGALQVQCNGTFGNIIPPGPQILMPSSISYIVKPKEKLCKNIQISTGATNTTQFTGAPASNALRDSQVNDAFAGVVAWAWGDNSNVADKTNGTLNSMVAVGKTSKDGKLKVRPQVQLTNLPPNVAADFDHAVAINRQDPNNIIVSYVLIDYNTGNSLFCRAVSFDGGKTWPAPFDGVTPQPFNGPLVPQPPFGVGDALGVASDKFGNIWYGANPLTDDPAYFMVSTNQGVDFEIAFRLPEDYDPNVAFIDFPQYCFGGDANGNYGLWFQGSIINFVDGDALPTVGFIPIHGAGLANIDVANASYTTLPQFTNSLIDTVIAASSDGRVWFQGTTSAGVAGGPFPQPYTFIQPIVTCFKSPGLIDRNYAGSWNNAMANLSNANYFGSTPITDVISQPVVGYIQWAPRSLIFDESRQALYAIITAQAPDFSQNMQIYFIISRNNGQTWSSPIDINSTNFANRGFTSMALDTVTGNLVFGWYDGRNDPTFQSVEYFGSVLPAKTLDKLVKDIPLSFPAYTLPSAAVPLKSKGM